MRRPWRETFQSTLHCWAKTGQHKIRNEYERSFFFVVFYFIHHLKKAGLNDQDSEMNNKKEWRRQGKKWWVCIKLKKHLVGWSVSHWLGLGIDSLGPMLSSIKAERMRTRRGEERGELISEEESRRIEKEQQLKIRVRTFFLRELPLQSRLWLGSRVSHLSCRDLEGTVDGDRNVLSLQRDVIRRERERDSVCVWVSM